MTWQRRRARGVRSGKIWKQPALRDGPRRAEAGRLHGRREKRRAEDGSRAQTGKSVTEGARAACFRSQLLPAQGGDREEPDSRRRLPLIAGAAARGTREEGRVTKREGNGERGSGQLLASRGLHVSAGRGEEPAQTREDGGSDAWGPERMRLS